MSVFSKFITYCQRFLSLVSCLANILISQLLHNYQIHAPVGEPLVLLSSTAQTPIEEFTPTPAFPALQYLESVDEGGVAWRAGLRMGDFLIEVIGMLTEALLLLSIQDL